MQVPQSAQGVPGGESNGLAVAKTPRLSPARETLAKNWSHRLSAKRGKWCRSCRQWLPLEAFRPNPNNRNGIDSWCRPCHAKAVREWRAKNGPEYNARRRREYRDAHPLQKRPCVVCGKAMTKRPDALVCGKECRRQRKIEQRRAARASH